MEVTGAEIGPGEGGYVVKASGTGFPADLVARLGSQPVRSIRVAADGTSFSGTVDAEPKRGDGLFVGRSVDTLMGTSVQYKKHEPPR